MVADFCTCDAALVLKIGGTAPIYCGRGQKAYVTVVLLIDTTMNRLEVL